MDRRATALDPDTLLYLSRDDIRRLRIGPEAARDAVLASFRDYAAGRTLGLPKSTLAIGPGHGFQSMPAASSRDGLATLKWVAVAPVPAGSRVAGVNALICASDYVSGALVAVLDGDEITLLRTAAMSAAAASRLAPPAPRTIGFVGCGAQALGHLDAFAELFPSLSQALAFSRSEPSAQRLAQAARTRGLDGGICSEPDALLDQSDIVISSVPGAPGFSAFLDARKLPPGSFVSSVDTGRSWRPETLTAFDRLATDSLEQSSAPYDVDANPVSTVRFGTDLVQLSTEPAGPQPGRSMFCFRGHAIGDLALTALVLSQAQKTGIGTRLPR